MLFCLFGLVLIPISASAQNWAVWKHNQSQPGAVAVAPVGKLKGPWAVDSLWYANEKGAWKKACWLVRNGDLYGRRYLSSSMSVGRVSCDLNCNCRF